MEDSALVTPVPTAPATAAPDTTALTATENSKDLDPAVAAAETYWLDPARRNPEPVNVSILQNFLTGTEPEIGLEEPGDYQGMQLPMMPRTVGLPTYTALPDNYKKSFPERTVRKPMIRLYCFPGAADNYMLWIPMATQAPEWCEVAIYEARAHGFRPDEPWDRTLEERAEDAFAVMRPAFETHARGGVSEGAPFAFLSHGVGSQFVALLAHRLKREMAIEPLCFFANDGPPPNVHTFSHEGYKLLCDDAYNFCQAYMPGTAQQADSLGGKDSRAGGALLRKWTRDLRMFEEHSYRCERMEEPVYHQFNCDLHVIVGRHSQHDDIDMDSMPPEARQSLEARALLLQTGTQAIWDREMFRKWEQWTIEDFHYHEVDSTHDALKNDKIMQNIVFKELGVFCGMEYREE